MTTTPADPTPDRVLVEAEVWPDDVLHIACKGSGSGWTMRRDKVTVSPIVPSLLGLAEAQLRDEIGRLAAELEQSRQERARLRQQRDEAHALIGKIAVMALRSVVRQHVLLKVETATEGARAPRVGLISTGANGQPVPEPWVVGDQVIGEAAPNTEENTTMSEPTTPAPDLDAIRERYRSAKLGLVSSRVKLVRDDLPVLLAELERFAAVVEQVSTERDEARAALDELRDSLSAELERFTAGVEALADELGLIPRGYSVLNRLRALLRSSSTTPDTDGSSSNG